MATTKKAKLKADEEAPVHTEATATLLSFANPPTGATPGQIARDCVAGGLNAIGIHGPFNDNDKIDFGTIEEGSCVDFAHSIELCVSAKGFKLPPLAGTFVHLHANGSVIAFGNLVAAIAKLMKPKTGGA